MWIVELAPTEAPERLAARPAHRALLTALHEKGVVRMSGPLADDRRRARLRRTGPIRAGPCARRRDPYFTTPGVEVTRVRGGRRS
ncbi:hypothetical protein V2I01_16625 [Micromonospora sp. BRA006-A]|nr:hypothetical protein [Micromonospora sp. BRA006-A]